MTGKRMPASLRAGGLLETLCSGKPNQAAFEGLWLASQLWIKNGGVLPLQRYFGVLATGPALTQASRNLWLRRAAQGLPENTLFAQAHQLAGELEKFITRGPWLTWCKSQHPPAEASELRTALFYAAKFNGGELISARQIYRVLS